MLTSTKETRPAPAIPPGTGLGGTGGLATPSRQLRAGVLGQDVDLDFELRRGELELAGEVLADAVLGPPQQGQVFSASGRSCSMRMCGRWSSEFRRRGRDALGGAPAAAAVGPGGGGRGGLDRGVVEVEEMTLSRVVDEPFAAGAEDVAAEQRQRLGQLGVLVLQPAVVGRGLIEHAVELVDASLGVSACLRASSACR